jgi:hypothetical protein
LDPRELRESRKKHGWESRAEYYSKMVKENKRK